MAGRARRGPCPRAGAGRRSCGALSWGISEKGKEGRFCLLRPAAFAVAAAGRRRTRVWFARQPCRGAGRRAFPSARGLPAPPNRGPAGTWASGCGDVAVCPGGAGPLGQGVRALPTRDRLSVPAERLACAAQGLQARARKAVMAMWPSAPVALDYWGRRLACTVEDGANMQSASCACGTACSRRLAQSGRGHGDVTTCPGDAGARPR